MDRYSSKEVLSQFWLIELELTKLRCLREKLTLESETGISIHLNDSSKWQATMDEIHAIYKDLPKHVDEMYLRHYNSAESLTTDLTVESIASAETAELTIPLLATFATGIHFHMVMSTETSGQPEASPLTAISTEDKPAKLHSISFMVNYVLQDKELRDFLSIDSLTPVVTLKNNILIQHHTLRRPKVIVFTTMYAIHNDSPPTILIGHGIRKVQAFNHLYYQLICHLINKFGMAKIKSKMFSGNVDSISDDEIWTKFDSFYKPSEPTPQIQTFVDQYYEHHSQALAIQGPKPPTFPTKEEISDFVHFYSRLLILDYEDGACVNAEYFTQTCSVTWQVGGLRKFLLIPATTGLNIGELIGIYSIKDDVCSGNEAVQATVQDVLQSPEGEIVAKLEIQDPSFYLKATTFGHRDIDKPLQNLPIFSSPYVQISKVAEMDSYRHQTDALHKLDPAHDYETSETPDEYVTAALPSMFGHSLDRIISWHLKTSYLAHRPVPSIRHFLKRFLPRRNNCKPWTTFYHVHYRSLKDLPE